MPVTKRSGFTLIELVIGIIVFAVALVLFTSLIVPQAIRSVDPIFQVRAAELGQSLINEIASKSFDENSSRTGSGSPCNINCTAPNNLGSEGTESRASYDDVDDYHGLDESDEEITNALDESSSLYQGFTVRVSVSYDSNMDGNPDSGIGSSKLITVTVTTPNDEDIVFSTYRSNY